MRAYLRGVVHHQLEFLRRDAEDQQAFRRDPRESIATHVKTVGAVLEILPHLVPNVDIGATAPVLGHPDLSQSNIVISDDVLSPAVQGFIDWQDAQVLPLLYGGAPAPAFMAEDDDIYDFYGNVTFPRLVRAPEDLSVIGIGPENEKRARKRHRDQTVERMYLHMMYAHGRRIQALRTLQRKVLGALPDLVVRSWEEGLTPLRRVLFEIYESWSALSPTSPVPRSLQAVVASRQQTDAVDKAWDESVSLTYSVLRSVNAGPDGKVWGWDHPTGLEQVRKQKDAWKGHELTQFPLRNGAFSFFLS